MPTFQPDALTFSGLMTLKTGGGGLNRCMHCTYVHMYVCMYVRMYVGMYVCTHVHNLQTLHKLAYEVFTSC